MLHTACVGAIRSVLFALLPAALAVLDGAARYVAVRGVLPRGELRVAVAELGFQHGEVVDRYFDTLAVDTAAARCH